MTNQCVICGGDMPEGDQVCRGCSISNAEVIGPMPSRLFVYWRGEAFEVPSVEWLREAIQEKREREATP